MVPKPVWQMSSKNRSISQGATSKKKTNAFKVFVTRHANGVKWSTYGFLNSLVDICPFMGSLIPLFWTSGVSKPELAALFALSGGLHDVHSPRFISGVTPANHLKVSMAGTHACLSKGRMPDSNGIPPSV